MKCLVEDTAVIAIDFQERMMPVIEDGETVVHRRLQIPAVIRAVQEGVYITTYEAILFELARRCKTDTFKIISNLVK